MTTHDRERVPAHGPIARNDWSVVDAHIGALQESRPELEPMYRVLAEATAL
jgi:predicted short-subunit dehydrogenase-like oxidoreductase (DUF2520 family)